MQYDDRKEYQFMMNPLDLQKTLERTGSIVSCECSPKHPNKILVNVLVHQMDEGNGLWWKLWEQYKNGG